MSIKFILEKFKEGKITLEEAEKKIKLFDIEKIKEIGAIDINRDYRTGVPEVVLGEGKRDEEIVEIVKGIVAKRGKCMVTRLKPERIGTIKEKIGLEADVHEKAGIIVVRRGERPKLTGGRIAILSAGTSDISKAEEAKVVSMEMGCEVYTFYDVGVAGIHRLISPIEEIIKKDVDAVIVAAGMEGALPSVVAGLVDVPVIGLPVSTGYGVGAKGEAALLAMLQSCSPGLSVVNIDNGFGAGIIASMIANRVAKFRNK
jgi:hypothetical protein